MATDPGATFGPRADRPLIYEPPPGAELTPAELAALARLDDGPLDPAEDDDPYGDGFGPDNCPPEGWESMSAAERWAFLESEPASTGPVMAAQRRLASRAAAGELAAVTELAARRAGPGGRPGEHVEEEIAALLTLTGRAAGRQAALAEGLARLPGVSRALAAGRIDLPKATVFADQLALVEYVAANAIAAITLPDAPGQTTGQLRAALQREVLAYDPEAAIRRRKEAEKDARVETWTEGAGTGAIAGRDLPPADVLAADKTLDADARWLKDHGAEGSMDQLRAKAFTARLTGQPLQTLLCPAPGTGAGASPSLGPGASATPSSDATSGWPGALSRVNLVMPAAPSGRRYTVRAGPYPG